MQRRADRVADPDPGAPQRVREPVHARIELAVGAAARAHDQRGLVGTRARVMREADRIGCRVHRISYCRSMHLRVNRPAPPTRRRDLTPLPTAATKGRDFPVSFWYSSCPCGNGRREGVTRVPFWVYTDPDVYAREQERIFDGPSWSYVGLAAEIPQPGRLQA